MFKKLYKKYNDMNHTHKNIKKSQYLYHNNLYTIYENTDDKPLYSYLYDSYYDLSDSDYDTTNECIRNDDEYPQ